MRTLLREVTRARQAWYRALLRKDLWLERLSPLAQGMGHVGLLALGTAAAPVAVILTSTTLAALTHSLEWEEKYRGWPVWSLLVGLVVALGIYLLVFSRIAADFFAGGPAAPAPAADALGYRATLVHVFLCGGLMIAIVATAIMACGF